jgi:hypothetical protein
VRIGQATSEFYFVRQGETAVITTTPGATVTLNGQTVIAGADGRAFFPNTPPGTYELRITLAGFNELFLPEVKIP